MGLTQSNQANVLVVGLGTSTVKPGQKPHGDIDINGSKAIAQQIRGEIDAIRAQKPDEDTKENSNNKQNNIALPSILSNFGISVDDIFKGSANSFLGLVDSVLHELTNEVEGTLKTMVLNDIESEKGNAKRKKGY